MAEESTTKTIVFHFFSGDVTFRREATENGVSIHHRKVPTFSWQPLSLITNLIMDEKDQTRYTSLIERGYSPEMARFSLSLYHGIDDLCESDESDCVYHHFYSACPNQTIFLQYFMFEFFYGTRIRDEDSFTFDEDGNISCEETGVEIQLCGNGDLMVNTLLAGRE